MSWKQIPDAGTATLTGTWLVITPGGGADGGTAVADALARHGAAVLTAELADPSAESVRELVAAHEPSGIVSLLPTDERPDAAHPAVTAGLAAPSR
ncbi:hypothetical protein ACFQX6_00175 [Streptosporangium lutulentum]